MNYKYKVSVVLGTYNGEKFLNQQLESIENQTHRIDTIIVMDDCSTDDTRKILDEYSYKFEKNGTKVIKIYRKHNVGYIKNFLHGVSLIDEGIIFTCDQDDIWMPNKVEEMLNVFESIEDCIALHGNTSIIDINGNIVARNIQNYKFEPQKLSLKKMVKKVNYPGMSLAFKAEVVNPLLEEIKKTDVVLPTHDWVICFLACINGGFYVTGNILSLRRNTGENVALEIHESRVSSISERIKGIELYRRYYNFISDYQNGYSIIDIEKYLFYSAKRIAYLRSENIISWIKNVKGYRYYPSSKAYIADGIILLKDKYRFKKGEK